MNIIPEESSWEIKNNTSYPKLTKNISADVVIIGAGIVGIFNAYLLAKAGLSVVVLEKEPNILQNTTLYTTAFITQIIDTSFPKLIGMFGKEKAILIWQSGQQAINLIEDIIKKEHIDCEFELVSAYTYAKDEKQFKKLAVEHACIKKYGFESNLRSDAGTLAIKNSGFLEIPKQAKFHPIKFAKALADLAQSAGAKIFTDSAVVAIENTTVKTQESQVQTKDIIIATYAPLTNEGTRFKKAMYESYVYELEITKGLIPKGLYFDMANPYHYFRIDLGKNTDRMIVGGEDHRKDIAIDPKKNFYALQTYVNTVMDDTHYTIKRKWSGRILESVDGLPFIGAIKPHVLVATAFSGNGITYSAVSAAMMCDAILGKKNPYSPIYNPKRIPTLRQLTAKGADFSKIFFGGAFKNYFNKKAF